MFSHSERIKPNEGITINVQMFLFLLSFGLLLRFYSSSALCYSVLPFQMFLNYVTFSYYTHKTFQGWISIIFEIVLQHVMCKTSGKSGNAQAR